VYEFAAVQRVARLAGQRQPPGPDAAAPVPPVPGRRPWPQRLWAGPGDPSRYSILANMAQPRPHSRRARPPGRGRPRGNARSRVAAAKRSPRTQTAYLRDLALWLGWLAGHGIPPL